LHKEERGRTHFKTSNPPGIGTDIALAGKGYFHLNAMLSIPMCVRSLMVLPVDNVYDIETANLFVLFGDGK